MGQQEISDILEKSKVPLSAKEIAELLKQAEFVIVKTLKTMLKYHDVKCVELNKDLAMKFYRCKRRMRLYYSS